MHGYCERQRVTASFTRKPEEVGHEAKNRAQRGGSSPVSPPLCLRHCMTVQVTFNDSSIIYSFYSRPCFSPSLRPGIETRSHTLYFTHTHTLSLSTIFSWLPAYREQIASWLPAYKGIVTVGFLTQFLLVSSTPVNFALSQILMSLGS